MRSRRLKMHMRTRKEKKKKIEKQHDQIFSLFWSENKWQKRSIVERMYVGNYKIMCSRNDFYFFVNWERAEVCVSFPFCWSSWNSLLAVTTIFTSLGLIWTWMRSSKFWDLFVACTITMWMEFRYLSLFLSFSHSSHLALRNPTKIFFRLARWKCRCIVASFVQ